MEDLQDKQSVQDRIDRFPDLPIGLLRLVLCGQDNHGTTAIILLLEKYLHNTTTRTSSGQVKATLCCSVHRKGSQANGTCVRCLPEEGDEAAGRSSPPAKFRPLARVRFRPYQLLSRAPNRIPEKPRGLAICHIQGMGRPALEQGCKKPLKQFVASVCRGKFNWNHAETNPVHVFQARDGSVRTDLTLPEAHSNLRLRPSMDAVMLVIGIDHVFKDINIPDATEVDRKLSGLAETLACYPMFKVVLTRVDLLVMKLYGHDIAKVDQFFQMLSKESLHRHWIRGTLAQAFPAIADALNTIASWFGRPKCYAMCVPESSTTYKIPPKVYNHVTSDLLAFGFRILRHSRDSSDDSDDEESSDDDDSESLDEGTREPVHIRDRMLQSSISTDAQVVPSMPTLLARDSNDECKENK
eukprot:TRINITY_DN18685_c0_g1_i1.p1 TRINITY_DN18685_c0_g1~~TRINITY_DN18685_c0_g1_i1.p1  ORF type:complete len:421 (+),score=-9.94 TRINITY_DN18685_c0_g1_i1:32-1264(+)